MRRPAKDDDVSYHLVVLLGEGEVVSTNSGVLLEGVVADRKELEPRALVRFSGRSENEVSSLSLQDHIVYVFGASRAII